MPPVMIKSKKTAHDAVENPKSTKNDQPGHPSSEATLFVAKEEEPDKTYSTNSILSHKWISGELWLQVTWKPSWEREEELEEMVWKYKVTGSKIQNGISFKYVEWGPTFEPEKKLRKFLPDEDGDTIEEINNAIDEYIDEFVTPKENATPPSKSTTEARKRGRVVKKQAARKKAKF